MAGGVFSEAQLFGMTIRESATDGSDFTNPAADYRRLFLGEDGLLHLKDSAGAVTDIAASGAVATDTIWDAAGDLVQGTGANTAAKLGAGLAGQTLRSAGAAAANAWAYPPGYEFDYVQITSPVAVTALPAGTPDVCITGNAVTYDGATIVRIEVFSPSSYADNTALGELYLYLFDGATSIGLIAVMRSETTNRANQDIYGVRRLTPSNAAHTYSVRATQSVTSGDAQFGAGAGGTGQTNFPAFMRITKV